MSRLTKRIIDAAEPSSKELYIWDKALPGFGLRVMPSGRKSFVVQDRAGRRSRRITLGSATVITPEQARTRAIAIISEARSGKDPAADRDAERKAMLVTELAQRFDEQHIAIRIKESTAREYRRNLRRFILPAIGRMKVTEVTRADIAKFHHDLRHIPYQANRCLEIISKMFNLAEVWGLRADGSNPRRHLQKYPEKKRERYLSPAELKRVGEVLREVEDEGRELTSAVLAIRLLIYTGCRLSEITKLKWEYVDLEGSALHLPDSKTGAKTVHIGRPAVELLENAPVIVGNPWVITGKIEGGRLSDLQPFWQRIRARAGLHDVRIHDLRHTFASTAVGAGQSLPMIGALLGHTQVQTTARYAHLASAPVKGAAEIISDLLERALTD